MVSEINHGFKLQGKGEMGRKKPESEKLIVICAYCKKIVGEEKLQFEENDHQGESETLVSHGICPDCFLKHFPNEYLAIQKKEREKNQDNKNR